MNTAHFIIRLGLTLVAPLAVFPHGAAAQLPPPQVADQPAGRAISLLNNAAQVPGAECRLVGGMAVPAIKTCFGEPDAISDEKTRQVWRYGDCELYVADNKLIAWLNGEELADRRRMAALSRHTDQNYDPTDKAHWINEWTPRKEVLPQEELLDLVGDENEEKKEGE